MTQTRIVVELLAEDPSGAKLLSGLTRSFDISFPQFQCIVERKESFLILPTFEEGARKLIDESCRYPDPWCVYVAPRRFCIKVNKANSATIVGALVAVSRNRKPAGFFLQIVQYDTGTPDDVVDALELQVEQVRQKAISYLVPAAEEKTIWQLQDAVLGGYKNAFSGQNLNS